jgi:imidazole glycerol phosphate synthase glutamine amidotransferase subunit
VRIGIVDYGAGNLASVERALRCLGAEAERITEPERIASADALVLPGVGHFSAFVDGICATGLAPALQAAIDSGVPVLGICLGLQAMFSGSAEAPGKKGLGLFPETVCALPESVKSPHIGWNQVRRTRESTLLRSVAEDAHFYFAHSYAAPACGAAVVAVCEHGFPFSAVIERGNLMAVQFHPEKSGAAGAQVLANFLEAMR